MAEGPPGSHVHQRGGEGCRGWPVTGSSRCCPRHDGELRGSGGGTPARNSREDLLGGVARGERGCLAGPEGQKVARRRGRAASARKTPVSQFCAGKGAMMPDASMVKHGAIGIPRASRPLIARVRTVSVSPSLRRSHGDASSVAADCRVRRNAVTDLDAGSAECEGRRHASPVCDPAGRDDRDPRRRRPPEERGRTCRPMSAPAARRNDTRCPAASDPVATIASTPPWSRARASATLVAVPMIKDASLPRRSRRPSARGTP